MGLFSKLFGPKIDYPPLDGSTEAARTLEEVRAHLEKLAEKAHDRLEIVPAEHAAYVFIGKPPKAFGLAWIQNGELHNLKTFAEEKGLNATDLEPVVDKLAKAYEASEDASRYQVTVADQPVVVTPSAALEHEVHDILQRLAA